MPRSLATSHELIPFLQLAIIQVATIHLSRGIGESSKIVPTLIENCRLSCRFLQRQILRVAMKCASFAWQCGQVGPSGHTMGIRNCRQVSGSEKYRIASIKVLGSLLGFMP